MEDGVDQNTTTDDEYWTYEEVAFSCKLCPFVGNSESEINEHKKSHQCKLCDFSCKSRRGLLVHVALIHEKEDGVFQCDICNFTGKSRVGLGIHKTVAHNMKKENVKIQADNLSDCDYSAKVSGELTNHTLTKHKKPHECKLCDFSFKSRLGLYMHVVQIHEREDGVFQCKICPFNGKSRGA